MDKKTSWKRKVVKIFLVSFGLLFLLLIVSILLLIILGPKEIEMTEYYPFKSAEAKKQCLTLYKEYEKANWPPESESRYVDTSYGKTFVWITGPKDAPPLVLLHGQGVNSLVNWSSNIKELSKEFRTYAVDTIGDYGLSTCTKPIKKPDDYVQWLDELFTGLGLEDSINLMGHSYGGWLLSQYTLRFQNRLNKLVLIAPGGTIVPINPQFMVRYLLSSLPFEYFNSTFYSWMDPVGKDSPTVKQRVEFMNTCANFYKVKNILPPIVLNDEELKSIKCPALFLVGEHERVFSPDKAMDRLERIVPHFKKKIIPGTGHLSMLFSPLTTETILAFLKE
jgi:pimeloyl-ACP methyl ester carboxylesterase